MAVTLARRAFGGAEVFHLHAPEAGIRASVTNFGATLLSVKEREEELTCNFPDPAAVMSLDPDANPFFGKTAGRFANRIAKGRFELNGRQYSLAVNNGPNALHGGVRGFDKQLWSVDDAAVDADTGSAEVRLSHLSLDGEEGYPGEVAISCTFRLSTCGDLSWTYAAEMSCTEGRGGEEGEGVGRGGEEGEGVGEGEGEEGAGPSSPLSTPVNLTNHAYWNLSGDLERSPSGATSIVDHELHLNCDRYLPVDEHSIPCGHLAPVAGTAFDFFSAGSKTIGSDIGQLYSSPQKGFDHCMVLAGDADAGSDGSSSSRSVAFMGGRLNMAASVRDPASQRQMQVYTSAPGVQFYTGNFLDNGTGVLPMTQHAGFCLETQLFPDAINHADWRDSCILKPGERYEVTTLHRFDRDFAFP